MGGGEAVIAAAGEYVKRIPVGRLETVAQWRRLVGRIMRAMLKGDMPLENGTKLIWAARVGADMAKAEQEQRALEELNEKLARLEADKPAALPLSLYPAPVPAPSYPQGRALEVLPADSSEEGL